MTLKQFWERELYVALHAQTWRFRIVKYVILAAIFAGVYAWGGWSVLVYVLAALTVLAFAIHFLFRWKTKAWTHSWGPYKQIPLPNES